MNKITYDLNSYQIKNLDFKQALNKGQDDSINMKLLFELDDEVKFDLSWQVWVTFERPDGSTSTNMLATLDGKYYELTIGSWFTDIVGIGLIQVRIKQAGVEIYAFPNAKIPINDGINAIGTTIDEEEYNTLLGTINNVNNKLEAHKDNKNNPHNVTAEQIDTYTKLVIDNKDANTLQAAKDYTYSKVEIDNKDTQVLVDAKQYTDSELVSVKGRITQNETDILSNKGRLSANEQAITNLDNDKVDKKTTIIGLDLKDNILIGDFKAKLGNAKQSVAGLLSAEDKTHLDGLVALLETNDGNNVVDTIGEILAIFQNYPEGADLVTVLQGKVDKVEGKGLSTNDLTDILKNQYGAAYAHSQIVGANPHQTTYAQLLNKPTTIEQAGILNVYNKEYIDTLKDKNGWESELLGTLENNGTIALSIINQYDEIQMYAKDTLGVIDNENIRPNLMQSGDSVYFFDDTQAFIMVDTVFGFYAPADYTLQVVGLKYTELKAVETTYEKNASGLDAENVQEAIDELEIKKVDKTSIVNNVTTDDATKVLSANQGKVLNDTTAKLAVSNVFTQPQQVPSAVAPQHAVNKLQVETMFEMFKQQLRGYNLAMPNLEGKEYLGDGVYRLYDNNGITIDYNVYNGYYIMNGTSTTTGLGAVFKIPQLEKGLTYTVSRQVISGTKTGNLNIYISAPVQQLLHNNQNQNTFVAGTNHENILFSDLSTIGTVFNDYTFILQIEKGDTATPYTVPGQIPQYKIVGEE